MRFDVFGMCNALYDLQAEVDDSRLAEVGLAKGGMFLLSHEQQRAIVPRVYDSLVNTAPGGSGANTMSGVALLGGQACYTSHVGSDEHGALYRKGLADRGVQPNLGVGQGDTGICVVLITPDAQRTMGAYLGESQNLEPADVRAEDLRDSRYLYITGYLWDTPSQRESVLYALKVAREAGVRVAFSLSDSFCVDRHLEDFQRLARENAHVLFGNADEVKALTGLPDAREAARVLSEHCDIVAVTMDRGGSLIVQGGSEWEIPVYPVQAVDTTGAGDAYAAGLLWGLTQDLRLDAAGRAASWFAAQVVAQLGPRLERLDRAALEAAVRG